MTSVVFLVAAGVAENCPVPCNKRVNVPVVRINAESEDRLVQDITDVLVDHS